jgi:hypothetical protein
MVVPAELPSGAPPLAVEGVFAAHSSPGVQPPDVDMTTHCTVYGPASGGTILRVVFQCPDSSGWTGELYFHIDGLVDAPNAAFISV